MKNLNSILSYVESVAGHSVTIEEAIAFVDGLEQHDHGSLKSEDQDQLQRCE